MATGIDNNGTLETISLGNYIIPKPDGDEVSAQTTFVGYDYMKKFDVPYVDTETYPVAMKTYLQHLCTKVGVTYGGNLNSLVNGNYMILGNPFTNGESCKTVLSNIAQLAGGFAHIGYDNKLYIVNLNVSGAVEETIGKNNYFNFSKNNAFGPVNSLKIQMNSGVDGEESVKEEQGLTDATRCQITIADNYFLTTEEQRELVINNIYDAIHNLTYVPCKFNYYGYPWLTTGTKIKVLDMQNSQCITYLFNHKFKYNGAYGGSIETKAMTKTQSIYKGTTSLKEWRRNTELRVNKIDGKIEALVTQVNENTEDIADLTIETGRIDAQVSTVADVTEEKHSATGTMTFNNVNQCEPIEITLYPLLNNISYLYLRDNLYLSDDLIMQCRCIRFHNNTTNKDIDYELPDDLLYYDATHYDKFILDRKNGICKVEKKCQYDANGNVVLLSTPRTDTYEYPTINLTSGNYTISTPKASNSLYTSDLTIRLMKRNSYLSQFATDVRLASEIEAVAGRIMLSVSGTYSTKRDLENAETELNASIELKVNKDDLISEINASADVISLNAGRLLITSGNFQLDANGNIVCSGGTIGGFGLSATEFQGALNGIYDYTEYEAMRCLMYSVDGINIPLVELDIYDVNNDGKVRAQDALAILKHAQGIELINKTVTGTVKINSKDPKNCFQILKGNSPIVSIGVGGINSTSMATKSFLCGTLSSNVTVGVLINGDTGKLISRDGNNNSSSISPIVIHSKMFSCWDSDASIQSIIEPTYISSREFRNTSLAELKKNITELGQVLATIKNSTIYEYNYKTESDSVRKHKGFVIGKEYNTPTEIMSTDKQGIDVYSMCAVLWKGMQEIIEKIERK